MLFKTLPALSFAAMAVFSDQASAHSIEWCRGYSSMVVEGFKYRQKGMEWAYAAKAAGTVEPEAMRGIALLAAARAYIVPMDTDTSDLAITTFNRCRADKLD
ncbi:hypothetical protein PPL19_19892 [Pseudomonas psychrotolerans L19]|uniref:hypothetical protein n=1 Tax=Pseudomonas TaxID=286 RepID=UPI00023A2B4B|nr:MULTISPECIES: hypothetical protein [Pseudomonas]EHK69356.1 hypothetical protein PPL19_19892 [Pseudomonas psychrotolerans L19]MBA1181267.1 hypothetical protein [Pseudomonas psychrotolerans]MBA1212799.1 hypothetical protein [Pseudomonas psychrotolerans]TCQ86375.1 hypothetical protein EC839_10819 [Pseudomonas sp. JUb52]